MLLFKWQKRLTLELKRIFLGSYCRFLLSDIAKVMVTVAHRSPAELKIREEDSNSLVLASGSLTFSLVAIIFPVAFLTKVAADLMGIARLFAFMAEEMVGRAAASSPRFIRAAKCIDLNGFSKRLRCCMETDAPV